jgi:hypothetical protein
MKRHRKLLSILALATLAGCGDGPLSPPVQPPPKPVDPPVQPPPAMSFAAPAALSPGDTATLTGTSLAKLDSLFVDGVPVSFQRLSDTQVAFIVPEFRSCDVDGRPVALRGRSNSDSAQVSVNSRVRVPTIQMEIGEIRDIDAAALPCLRFPATDQDYGIMAINRRVGSSHEHLAVFRSLTAGGDTTPARAEFSENRNYPFHITGEITPDLTYRYRLPPTTHSMDQAAANPVLFDPRYATAQVGDTVRMVDYTNTLSNTPRDAVNTYPALVLAIEGSHVVLLDLRAPEAEAIQKNHLAKLRSAAAAVDEVLMPTMRGVFGDHARVLPSAGGRYFTLVTDLGPNTTGADFSAEQRHRSTSTLSSEITIGRFNSRSIAMRDSPKIATTMVHELAHAFDWTDHDWNGRQVTERFYGEAIAVHAEMVAWRLITNQPVNARKGPTDRIDPMWNPIELPGTEPVMALYNAISGYTSGAAMVMYLSEMVGNDGINGSGLPFVERLRAVFNSKTNDIDRYNAWGLRGMAEAVGRTPEELIEEYSIALMTDDRVTGDPAKRSSLPHYAAIDHGFLTADGRPHWDTRFPQFYRTLGAAGSQEIAFDVSNGGYVGFYIRGAPDRGLSVKFDSVNPEPNSSFKVVRLR